MRAPERLAEYLRQMTQGATDAMTFTDGMDKSVIFDNVKLASKQIVTIRHHSTYLSYRSCRFQTE